MGTQNIGASVGLALGLVWDSYRSMMLDIRSNIFTRRIELRSVMHVSRGAGTQNGPEGLRPYAEMNGKQRYHIWCGHQPQRSY